MSPLLVTNYGINFSYNNVVNSNTLLLGDDTLIEPTLKIGLSGKQKPNSHPNPIINNFNSLEQVLQS